MLRYVINLDSSTDRWEAMKQKLASLNITAERISAVDGRKKSDKEIEDILYPMDYEYRYLFPRLLSKAEIGCFLSHRKCWQMLVESDEDWALIMEDDLIISDRAQFYMKDLSWLPQNIKICQLSTHEPNWNLWVKKETIKLSNNDEIIQPLDKAHGTQCYVISKEVALAALKYSEKLLAPVDDFLFSPYFEINKQFGCYRIHPTVVTQFEEGSVIGERKAESLKAPFFVRHGLKRFLIRNKIKIMCRTGIKVESKFI